MAPRRFLADTSALSRLTNPVVEAWLGPMVAEGAVATCDIVDLEVLYSARTPADYEEIRAERRAYPSVPITPEVMEDALAIQRALARRGRHRVSVPDLIVAAAAMSAHLTVVHYDRHFETIAEAVPLQHRWVAERGSLD